MATFSVVERQVYKRCKRKWGLQSENREGLEPIQNAPALVLGGLIQEALSNWTDGLTEEPSENFLSLAATSIASIKDSYLEQHGANVSDSELEPLFDAIVLGHQMILNYIRHYKRPLPVEYKTIHTEQRAIVAIPGTEHFLRGTLDTLVQQVGSPGKLFVLERKTYAIRPTSQKLAHDDQMLAYAWILSQLFGAQQVGGILYDGLWKRQEDKRHTLDDLFFRATLIRPADELEEFGRLLAIEANEMALSLQQPLEQLTINRRWEGCYDCGVAKICDAMSRGEDVDYVRDTHYRKRPSSAPIDDAGEAE